MLYLNKRVVIWKLFFCFLFIQSGTWATPHVEKETFQSNTLARATAKCWHIGNKIARIKLITLNINNTQFDLYNMIVKSLR